MLPFWPSGEIAAGCRPIDRARGQQSPLQTEHVRNRLAYPVLRGRRIDTCPIVVFVAIAAVACHRHDASTEKRRRSGIAIAHDSRDRPTRPFVVDDRPQPRDLDPPKSIPLGIGGSATARERVEMAVAGNDHQFARGPGSLESSRLRQSRGRDVPYRPAEEHEADIKDARIESLERAEVRWRTWRERRMPGEIRHRQPGGPIQSIRTEADECLDEW